ncbi:unnamed protein product [Ectocarpus sp. 8 AP-2014]
MYWWGRCFSVHAFTDSLSSARSSSRQARPRQTTSCPVLPVSYNSKQQSEANTEGWKCFRQVVSRAAAGRKPLPSPRRSGV